VRRLLATVALGALLLAASATAATAPNARNQAALDRSVRFLQDAQNLDGGFGGSPTQASGSMFSAWVALALAAAGINPQDQKKPGGVDVFTYLSTHYDQAIAESDCAPLVCTTTLERELMVVNASGTSPHDFGGVDLTAELLARAREDGSFPHVPGGQAGVNDTIFAIFALAPVPETAAQAAVQEAATWVEAAQHENGGWAWGVDSRRDEVDMTGAAIQGLAAAGRGRNEIVEDGLRYLRQAQNEDGCFPEFPGNPESNVASTAWAVQAIWAVGENPENWRTQSGAEPLSCMESLQEPDGHIRWRFSLDLNGIWMTAYVTPAFTGNHWPIPAPPRSLPPVVPPAANGGVIAGGGGRGAPLFGRPKPQSRGRTPGGARVLRSRDPVNHSHTRRGENREQPSGTFAEEASASSAASPPPEAEEESAAPPASGTGSAAGAAARALGGEGDDGSGNGGAGGGAGAVTGLLVGDSSEPVPGAPGLRTAADEGADPGVAIGIGVAALLAGLAGIWLERRRPWALPGVPA
jgi:prenyltransferase beta subunit